MQNCLPNNMNDILQEAAPVCTNHLKNCDPGCECFCPHHKSSQRTIGFVYFLFIFFFRYIEGYLIYLLRIRLGILYFNLWQKYQDKQNCTDSCECKYCVHAEYLCNYHQQCINRLMKVTAVIHSAQLIREVLSIAIRPLILSLLQP